MAFYLGRRGEDDLILFHSAVIPTKETHGYLYKAVIGPFKSKVGANYFVRYGRNNPRIRTAADAERLARADPRMEQLIVEESMTDEELAIALECDVQDQAEYSPKPIQIQGANPCLILLNTNA
jgi:hypothetical protein